MTYDKNNTYKKKERKLTLEERVRRIEKWIDFWETIPTPWKVISLPKKKKK